MTAIPYVARNRPYVIGHRGACGYRPEHTLASYWLAIQQGADFIEPDLVSTRDGVLVARHENEISETTDINDHLELASRRTTKLIDNRSVTGFFTEDFTLAELKTLRAKERLPELRPDNTRFDGMFTIPTLQEIIALAKLGSRAQGRNIGIYPETKHPSYFASIDLPLEARLVRMLHGHGYRGPNAPVFIQSFEVGNLIRLREMTQLPIIQLLEAHRQPYDLRAGGDARQIADLITPHGLREIASYANGIGVDKALIATGDGALIDDAHRAGLLVHAWTFRRENTFLPTAFQRHHGEPSQHARQVGDLVGEVETVLRCGLDGVFSDNPDLAVLARARVRQSSVRITTQHRCAR